MLRPDPLRDVVLIVDDAPENLSILHTLLDKSGYTVLVATDGIGPRPPLATGSDPA